MSHQKENLIMDFLDTRGFAYDVLKRVYIEEPSLALLDNLKNGIISSFPFVEEHPLIKEGVETVVSFLDRNQVSNIQDRLHWDYTRMFIGPHDPPAPLWESSYTNKEGLLFQTETLIVRQAYLKYSFIPVNLGSEADDHLGLELDFLCQLNNLTKEYLKANNNEKAFEVIHDQIIFLENHLLKWVPQLSEKISTNADYDFYKGMTKILQGFIELDKAILNELADIKDLQVC